MGSSSPGVAGGAERVNRLAQLCNRLYEIGRLLRWVLIIRFLSSVDGRLGSMASLEACADGLVLALVGEMEPLSSHRALRIRHALRAILGDDPSQPSRKTSRKRTEDPTAAAGKQLAGRGNESPGRGGMQSVLRDCCETFCESIERLVTDAPAMTDPETEVPTDSEPGTKRKTAPCREVNMSPCQQSVIHPFKNPFKPAIPECDNETTGCLP